MGIFEKLFGKKDNNPKPKSPHPDILIKTAEMLDEELFWKIVERSLKAKGQSQQEKLLVTEIEKLSYMEMIGFSLRTDELLHDTYTSEMWCAGYILNGGCSDDGFEYFRNWVISRGKNVYYKAKSDPDSLISVVDENAEYYAFEGFSFGAHTAFKNKTGKNLYDYIDYDNFTQRKGKYPPLVFTWQEETPDSMRKICPRLFDNLWEK
jgi:hypothetical protein